MGTRKNGGCQVIGEGGGKRFSGAFRAGAPSPLACLPLARPFSLSPTTSKRLLRRLLRNLLFLSRQQCRFTTLFKFLVYFIYNNFYYWISIKGFSKHELSTINMLYSLKKLSSYTPTSLSASYLCPRGGRCREVRLYIHFRCVFWR